MQSWEERKKLPYCIQCYPAIMDNEVFFADNGNRSLHRAPDNVQCMNIKETK